MKNFQILLIFILTCASTFGQKTALVSGKITDPNTDAVYLRIIKQGDDGKPSVVYLDSSAVDSENRFRLIANLDSTSQVSFFDGKESAQMLLAPGDSIYLTLNTAAFDETIQFYGEGSAKNNAIAAILIVDETNTAAVYASLEDERIDSNQVFIQNEKAIESYEKLVNSYQKEFPEFSNYGDQLIAQKKLMGERLKPYVRGKIIFKKKMESLLGKTAPDFTGVDLEGNEVSLSDFQGKTTVVDFWATWCGPCKAEFPAYKELEKKYGDEINFVSVAAFCAEDAWKEMATNEGFSHNIYLSKEATEQIAVYEVSSIPRYLVINEDFVLIDANAPRPSSGELEGYWLK